VVLARSGGEVRNARSLNMTVVRFFKTLVIVYPVTRRHISQNRTSITQRLGYSSQLSEREHGYADGRETNSQGETYRRKLPQRHTV
jgi:hypothetical protein